MTSTVKRIAFVLLTACAIVFATAGVAFANFGPHGGYLSDTDACAGCHRAHTSFSTTGWTDLQGAQRASALLVSSATNMTDFCYACHGNGAPGASTNVQNGIYDSGPSGTATASPNGTTIFAATNSSYDTTLNGGGFDKIGSSASPVMSSHNMGTVQGSLVRWGYADPNGGASNLTPMASFGCNDCHDPHGSSNYRLLKDQVNGVTVGGYVGNNTPNAYVISNEQGFPFGGFKKGALGAADIANYVPNYTAPEYAKLPGRAMSTWCSACHTDYNVTDGSKDSSLTAYTYGTAEGAKVRHRHPVDIALSVGTSLDPANRALNTPVLNDPGLPLEMGFGLVASGKTHTSAVIWDTTGNISCLTCHRAHGSNSTMTGWAVADIVPTTGGFGPVKLAPGNPANPGSLTNPLGVAPNYSGAILRFDNRGVCERCHNK